MKKAVIIICITIALAALFNFLQLGHALMLFYFMGIIPGTDIVVGGEQMLIAFMFLGGFTVSRCFNYAVSQLFRGTKKETVVSLAIEPVAA